MARPDDEPRPQPDDPAGPQQGGPAGQSPDPDDGLARLRERIEATRQAAERVAGDLESLGGRMRSGGGAANDPADPEDSPEADANGDRTTERPPRMGYAVPPSGEPRVSALRELDSLARIARDLLPEQLAHEIAELVRELLLLIRALIDWSLERLDRRRAAPVEVTDIPIS